MSDHDYATDFYAWTRVQAAALRNKDWTALDLTNLVEEIDSLGNEQEHAVESHLANLFLHLLKWRYQSERRSNSWRASIRNPRQEIRRRLRRNPSIGPRLYHQFFPNAYSDARKLASDETGLALTTFPEACPWTVAQVLDEDFWPEA